MSYACKYRIEYKRLSDELTTIDILDKALDSDDITYLIPTNNPLQTQFSFSQDNIFVPSIGTGATLYFLGIPLTLLGLFTEDPQKYIVNIYHGVSGSNLIWQGFINAEIYSENYSYSSDIQVPIIIQCNDGMQLLDNLLYLQPDGSHYLGQATTGVILTNILNKLAITFTNIYVSSDLLINDPSFPDTKNIFLYLSHHQENFIDESDVAWSCRKVLESIIGGLGFTIRFKAGDIYIYDPINLHDITKCKVYDIDTFTESPASIGGYLDISDNDVQWFETDGNLDIVPIKSEIDVKYDPYTFCNFDYDFSDKTNWSTEGTFTYQSGGWYYNPGIEYTGWTVPSTYYSIGLKETLNSETICCLAYQNAGSSIYMSYLIPRSIITQDPNLSLKISLDVYVQTKVNSLDIFHGESTADVYQVLIPITIKVGNQFYNGGDDWVIPDPPVPPSSLARQLTVRQNDISIGDFTIDPSLSRIEDKWTTGSIIIPINGSWNPAGDLINGGNLTIYLIDNIKTLFTNQILPTGSASSVYYILIKNLKIEIINTLSGVPLTNEGILIKGRTNTNLTGKDTFVINTTSGAGFWGTTGGWGTSKGSYLTDQSLYPGCVLMFKRAGTSSYYSSAEAIIQSTNSQYKVPRYKLSGVLNVTGQDIDLKLIKDTDYLGSKAFYIISNSYNDRDESADITMIELTSTRESFT